jgi:hypothetical protein
MPFRLLSDEGVRSLRHVVDDNMDLARQNDRNHSLRGLGYRSQWIRDMSFCPEIVDLVSQLAREELWPHDVLMHLAHTNLGKVGSGKAVDEWCVHRVALFSNESDPPPSPPSPAPSPIHTHTHITHRMPSPGHRARSLVVLTIRAAICGLHPSGTRTPQTSCSCSSSATPRTWRAASCRCGTHFQPTTACMGGGRASKLSYLNSIPPPRPPPPLPPSPPRHCSFHCSCLRLAVARHWHSPQVLQLADASGTTFDELKVRRRVRPPACRKLPMCLRMSSHAVCFCVCGEGSLLQRYRQSRRTTRTP